jgi:hypothetical protein
VGVVGVDDLLVGAVGLLKADPALHLGHVLRSFTAHSFLLLLG